MSDTPRATPSTSADINTRNQNREAQKGGDSLSARSSAILSQLEKRITEFTNVAKTVGSMNKTLTHLQSEMDSLKRQRTPEVSADEPPNKRVVESESSDDDQGYSQEEDSFEIDQFLATEDAEEESIEDDFLESISAFFPSSEETGEDLDPALALLVEKSLKGRAEEEKIKALALKHKRPANVEYLQVPKVDLQLWRQLPNSTKAEDHLLQKAHSTMALALIPLTKALGLVKGVKNPELKELIADPFKILTTGIAANTNARREKIKRDLDPKFKQICKNEGSATKLFGDHLQEEIKLLNDSRLPLTVSTSRRPFLGRRGGSQRRSFPQNQSRPLRPGNQFSPKWQPKHKNRLQHHKNPNNTKRQK